MPRCPACHRRLVPNATCPVDGQMVAPAAHREIERASVEPPAIPGYLFKAPLGDGGYAVVWTAQREIDGATVAVKLGHSDVAAVVARFAREAEILKSIGAPFAPQWYENGITTEGKPFIAMELIAGETLAQHLARRTLLPNPSWVALTAERMATALDALHSRSFVHRDLKPENIVLNENESRLVLLDFGLAKRTHAGAAGFQEPRITRAGMAIGTPEYMAPESVRGVDDVDARADIYAFGVLLFELFTLRVPFVGSIATIEHGHVSLRPPRPSDFAPVPPLWEQLILSCLAKDPARRPVNGKALQRAIREIFDVEPLLQSMAAPRNTVNVVSSAPKLLSEGRHPTVILFADVPGPAALICNRIKASRGHVVRQRGTQYTAIFLGFDSDDPVSAAVAAAGEIVQKNGRAALHLAQITIRRKDRGAPLAYGVAIEKPESWLPRNPWLGLWLSAEMEAILPPESMAAPQSVGPKSLRPSLRTPDFGASLAGEARTPDDAGQTGEFDRLMVGREDVLAGIASSICAAFEQRVPRLMTLVADTGLGKTRLAEHAIEYCRTEFPGASVVFAVAAPPGAGDGMQETSSILGQILDVPLEKPDDVQAFFVSALGDEFRGPAAAVLGALFGWNTPLAGDHAMHRTRAIAQALRRRARHLPVAVILDDAQRADDALLDALEYVTLDGDDLPIWVFVAASPMFDEQRRVWGRRTRHFDRFVLAPISNDAGKDLAAKLLLPAEYPPAAVLDRLATWAGGNPFCLREVVRTLKRQGIVKKREHGASHYVATADFESLPPIPAWQWLAVRQLDQMPPELAACVRLCAVLGVTFSRTEVEHVLDALDRTGKAGSPLDTDVALGVLAHRGTLRRVDGEHYSFQNGVLGLAIYELLDAAQRQEVHRHAFVLWNEKAAALATPNQDTLERLGRHAAAIGERQAAAQAFLQLGGLARQQHKDVDADRFYSAALAQAPEEDKPCRAQAFVGRGRSRYRVSRVKEAIDDFRHAEHLAAELGYRRMQAAVLLEQATAFDWSREFATSAEMVRLAEPILEDVEDRGLQVQLLVAQGRASFRAGKIKESIELLERARYASKEAEDYDAHVISLLLLGTEFAMSGNLDLAAERFQEVISMVEEANDRPHLCSALCNRVGLWFGRHELDRAMADLQRAIELAREIGNPWLERMAAHNIATLLLWSDERMRAVEFGRRAQLLTERFFEPPFITSSLLYARILLAVDAFEDAARLYAWIKQWYNPEKPISPRAHWNYELITLVLDEFSTVEGRREGGREAWEGVIARAVSDPEPQIIIEVLYWRLRSTLQAGALEEARQTLREVKSRLTTCPLWVGDFAALEEKVDTLEKASNATTSSIMVP